MSELTETQIESSDDELPEEVAFDASKSAALKSVKDALEAVKREKNLLKEKRKKRQQLFQEQKNRKRLPQELLEEFDKNPKKPTSPSNNKGFNKKVSRKASDNNKDETTPKKITKSLPHSYTVTRVKDESAAKSLQQKAVDFIQSRLYGPGTKRTTNAELLSLKKKRGPSQGAASEFANIKLSASQKVRIVRSNKQYLRQKKLLSS